MVERGEFVVVVVVLKKYAAGVLSGALFQVSPEEHDVGEWILVVSLDRHEPHCLVETICFGHGGWNGVEIHRLAPLALGPGNRGFHKQPPQPQATECAVHPETLHL